MLNVAELEKSWHMNIKVANYLAPIIEKLR